MRGNQRKKMSNNISKRTKSSSGIDFYQTPTWATQALLDRIDIEGKEILEPCSGAGAIANLLFCTASDLRTDEGVFGEKGKDIFTYKPKSFDVIITNPPFAQAQEIIEKSLSIATDRVYMLLKLQFLESARRFDFFQNTPLKRVFVFSKRITMYPDGEPEPKNSGVIAYAWYEWEHGYQGSPTIEWIL